MSEADPYRHHPELRGLITDPETSFFRDVSLDKLYALIAERGLPEPPFYTDEAREGLRREFLQGYRGDLWVFGYGSLLWDPAIHFEEIRRAHLADYERRFILKDVLGGRGDYDAPGLMVALDHCPGGKGCEGLIFRIAADAIEQETPRIWCRERLGPAYIERWVTVETSIGPLRAATFVADHEAELIAPDLTFEEQVAYSSTGEGILGTSLDYVRNIVQHFTALGIEDPEVLRLCKAAELARAAQR